MTLKSKTINKSTVNDKYISRAIAFYLPQYYPILENDNFWGKGFTEWTNVAKAKPLFPGHYQPNFPSELGFYDLRVPEVRQQQAVLAKESGIEAFCYWHYWFGNGKRVLDRVFSEVLMSGQPDFPFCLGWANESWTGRWHGLDNEIILEQTYPGLEDYRRHFEALLPAFADARYSKVNGKPIFLVYRPTFLPDARAFTEYWNELAMKSGFPGIYFIGVADNWSPSDHGFDKYIRSGLTSGISRSMKARLVSFSSLKAPQQIFEYKDLVAKRVEKGVMFDEIPCVIPNWDNTPRSGSRGRVVIGATPDLYGHWLAESIKQISSRDRQEQIVFLKSWNEWAEGNFLEPSIKWGKEYLVSTKNALTQRI